MTEPRSDTEIREAARLADEAGCLPAIAGREWISLLDALSAALAAKEAAEADAKWVRELLVSERAKHTQEREQWALTYVSEGTWRARAERVEAQVRAVRAQRDEWEANGEVGQCVLADIDAALAAVAPSEPQETTP